MTIELEKILAINVRDYVVSAGESLQDFQMVGVHDDHVYYNPSGKVGAIETFSEKVPDTAEVVVGYKIRVESTGRIDRGYFVTQEGTALVPK